MRCDDARRLFGPLVDGVASAGEAEAARAHAETCRDCGRTLGDLRRASAMLSGIGRMPVPAGLDKRVGAVLAAEAASSGSIAMRLRSLLPQAVPIAAACLVTAALTVLAVLALQPARGPMLAPEVLSAHIRSLLQDSPIQVASGDPHSVRPWFTGRVEFAPAVKDLGAEGFPLKGARLDYIGGRRVAALVYGRRLHVVNVFVWPAAGLDEAEPRLESIDGYNLAAWRRGGLAYWAVSDLNVGELRLLAGLL